MVNRENFDNISINKFNSIETFILQWFEYDKCTPQSNEGRHTRTGTEPY
jgi:hypothetical protein